MKRLFLMVGIPLAVFMTIVVFVVILPSEGYRKYQLKKVGHFERDTYVANPDEFTDDHFPYFVGDLDIKGLVLGGANISDEGMRNVRELSKLERLKLFDTLLSDKALSKLGPLGRFQSFILVSADITDHGLASLAELRHLEILQVSHTAITDDGLGHLQNLEYARVLNLSNNDITVEGVNKLVDVQIQTLNLTGTQVNDQIWETLAKIEGLSVVHLEGCEINGDGIMSLAGLINFRQLPLTTEGVMSICEDLGIERIDRAFDHLYTLRDLGKQVRRDGQINPVAFVELQALAMLANKNPEDNNVVEEILSSLESKAPKIKTLMLRNTKIPKHLVEALQVSLPDCHIVY